MSWHVDGSLLEQYIAADLDDARASSIEAHVIACSECRTRVADRADTSRVGHIWREVRESIDSPRSTVIERVLVRCGVRGRVARLISATPSLSASWLISVSIALMWAIVAARAGTKGVLLFLIAAPLIPLAGIVFAFGPRIDPTYEVGVAAPTHGFRVLLLRASCVLGTTLILLGIASIGLPDIGWRAAAWLLPALGVSLTTMALATWIEPFWAGGIVAFGWIVSTSLGPFLRHGASALGRIPAFTPAGQSVFAAMIGFALLVLIVRHGRFDIGRAA